MICTFCGTENPKGNRFCGMCGVRLERRKTERRTNQKGSTTCADCGHINQLGFKFCGMCGARVDRRMQERRSGDEASRATAFANVQLPTPEARRTAVQREPEMTRTSTSTLAATSHTRQPDVSSSVGGPSFLGLNGPSTETEYLLEDEGPRHRGLRAFLLLVVLAAIVGLIFVQYRSSLRANPKSPEQPNPGPATVPRSQGKNRQPGQEKPLLVAVAAHSFQSAVTGVATAEKESLKQASAKEADDPPDDESAAKESNRNTEVNAKPSPALVKAQKYLHGQGVRQNCEQGLIYLKAAARENDPKAAVQMAALYSSGFCVAQDRVKAYQWFSSARDMNPENRWISKNMNQLWAQMTPGERQQIHR
jgi:Double zinc ribbon